MIGRTPEKVQLPSDARILENAKAIILGDSKWMGATKILSEGLYADPILGNVIEHVTGQTASGNAVYIGTRLKVVDGKIKEVEINFDDSDRVNVKNLVPYDPIFNTMVPTEERSTREQLERIITSYFKGLTDHQPIQADYDPRCDRYHSGNRVTHNPKNGVEQSGDVGCYESNLGPKPWGPATEVRIGLIDPDRGIVIGYAILHYGDSPRRMQISDERNTKVIEIVPAELGAVDLQVDVMYADNAYVLQTLHLNVLPSAKGLKAFGLGPDEMPLVLEDKEEDRQEWLMPLLEYEALKYEIHLWDTSLIPITVEQPNDDPVICVDKNGLVHALREGKAVIVGDMDGFKSRVKVTVYTKENAPSGYRRVEP